MKSKQAKSGGYDHSRAKVAPYSANPRTGERIDNPARLDPRNAAAEKQANSRGGATYNDLNSDQVARAAARKDALQGQEKAKVKARGNH